MPEITVMTAETQTSTLLMIPMGKSAASSPESITAASTSTTTIDAIVTAVFSFPSFPAAMTVPLSAAPSAGS